MIFLSSITKKNRENHSFRHYVCNDAMRGGHYPLILGNIQWVNIMSEVLRIIIKRKLKQCWSSIPPISSKQTIISHLN
jgi:hypothetical protein